MWVPKYIFLHSEKSLLYPKMRSLSRDRPSSGVVFRCIQSSGLSPTWQFSPVKVEKVTVSRFCIFLVYSPLLFSPEFYFQSCLCYGENIRTPPFLVPGFTSQLEPSVGRSEFCGHLSVDIGRCIRAILLWNTLHLFSAKWADTVFAFPFSSR